MTAGAGEQPVIEFRSLPALMMGAGLSTILVIAALFGWMMLGDEIRTQFTIPQILTLLGFMAIMIGIMMGIGLSYVRVDDEGFHLRNGLRTHHYGWHEVRDVQFNEGDPWAYLVTNHTDEEDEQKTHFMLAIQSSEGPRAQEHVAELREAIRSRATRPMTED